MEPKHSLLPDNDTAGKEVVGIFNDGSAKMLLLLSLEAKESTLLFVGAPSLAILDNTRPLIKSIKYNMWGGGGGKLLCIICPNFRKVFMRFTLLWFRIDIG